MTQAAHGPAPDWPTDAVEVGKIVGAWGIKGGIKVHPYAADPQALFSSKRWFALTPGPKTGADPEQALLRVVEAREQGENIVARVHDVDDRNAAEALKGTRLFVSRASFPTASDGEYYWVDLIGLRVVNRAGDELGEVREMLSTGAHSVLCVAAEGDSEQRLIPFVDAYVDTVDLAQRRIVVDWGLDY